VRADDPEEHRSCLTSGHLLDQAVHARVDVVADQPHPLDSVDPALGGLVVVPVAQLGAGRDLDDGLAAKRDDQVDVAQRLGVDRGVGSARACRRRLPRAPARTAR
jgi:hypothetical protein